jgi:probable metal-binding protein
MSSVHGHQVLEMMIASGESFTTESLISYINQTFGSETRYHTCSASEMDARQLVDFLASRGKFIPAEDGFTTHSDKICQH